MNSIEKEIEEVMLKEYEGANKKFPMFRDLREAESVIREEMQELEDELDFNKNNLGILWATVKYDEEFRSFDAYVRRAKKQAIEAVQVYAMWYKLKKSMEEWEK